MSLGFYDYTSSSARRSPGVRWLSGNHLGIVDNTAGGTMLETVGGTQQFKKDYGSSLLVILDKVGFTVVDDGKITGRIQMNSTGQPPAPGAQTLGGLAASSYAAGLPVYVTLIEAQQAFQNVLSSAAPVLTPLNVWVPTTISDTSRLKDMAVPGGLLAKLASPTAKTTSSTTTASAASTGGWIPWALAGVAAIGIFFAMKKPAGGGAPAL